MRPASLSPAAAASPAADGILLNWHSPVPYLFGGIATMMALIAVALIVLSCSSHKSADDNNGSGGVRNTPTSDDVVAPVDDLEPKVLVIMPGESTPTYLAKMRDFDVPPP